MILKSNRAENTNKNTNVTSINGKSSANSSNKKNLPMLPN